MIDINRKLSDDELHRICRYVTGQPYRWDYTHYTGQVSDLRNFLIENVPPEQIKDVAKMGDQEVHNVIIKNLLIPICCPNDDEEVFLIPLETLEKLPSLQR